MHHPRDRSDLLDRTAELAAVEGAVRAAAEEGPGAAVALEGFAGIGKTSVLAAAEDAARAAGLDVLRATGGELERDLSFGAVRQLFEPLVRRATAQEREALFAGPARQARGVLEGAGPGGDEPSVVHGLFWLLANVCETGPALLALDDLQWWDAESLRFLDHLVRRLEDLPVAAVFALRSPEEAAEPQLIRRLLSHPLVERRQLQPLSPGAIGTLAQRVLDGSPSPRFVEAVREVTLGNPLLVTEVLGAARRERSRPDDLAAQRVRDMSPAGVAASARERLDTLGPATVVVARAIAVLGRHATTALTARLAGTSEDEVVRIADALEAHGLIARSRPLELSHPVLRAAVHDDMPTGQRMRMHRQAAELLRAADARADEVGSHLLDTEPAGDPETARMLRAAAASTSSPDRALALLHRALAEPPPPEERADLLIAIGELESGGYRPSALERLNEARALAPDRPTERRALLALTRAWTLDNRPQEVVALVDRELARLGDDPAGPEDEELRLALLALRVIRGPLDRPRALELRAAARENASEAARYLLAALAYKGFAWGTADEARALAEEAYARGMQAEGSRGTGFILVTSAFEQAGARRRNLENSRSALAVARDSGDVSGYVLALCLYADVLGRESLPDAAAEMRDALALASDHGLEWIEPATAARSAEIHVDAGRLEEADALLDLHAPTGWQLESSRAAQFFQSRALLRASQGRHEEAVEDAVRAGELCRRYTIDHTAMTAWRATAARALVALGRLDEARAMADEELSLARGYGCGEVIGRALIAWAATRDAAEGREALEEAVATLQAAEAPLPLARAYVEHGSLLRRAGRRKRAQEQLSAGLDLAARTGASPLAERATTELRALGARPRRAARSGPEALTPSERRVAELAAAGLSNKDIAQELFVSARTVGNQLQHAYLKLGIRSRQELPEALSGAD